MNASAARLGLLAAVLLLAIVGCAPDAKKSADAPVNLAPAADPDAGMGKGQKAKAPPMLPRKQ
jgi:hypothetical protein